MRRLLIAFLVADLWMGAQTVPLIPDNLKPPEGEKLIGQVQAQGDQIYTCDGSSWVLTGPDAKLFDNTGKQVGSHFAGPTWEWSDGSRVVGRPAANATPDADSIAWLLLKATDHQGEGFLKQVSSIQRISTKGGKASATGCNAARKGEKSRTHYAAVYRFFGLGL